MNSTKNALMRTSFILLAAIVHAPIAHAQLETLTFQQGVDGYEGTADTFISLDFPDNGGGGTDVFFVGTTAGNTTTDPPARRGLLRFDLSSIPAGFMVTSVTLDMQVDRAPFNTPPTMETTMHRVLTNWGEGDVVGAMGGGFGGAADVGDATWNSAFHNQVSWMNEGGDFENTASATATVQGENTEIQWSGEGLVADVQAWIDNPSTNFGWIFIGEGEGVDERRVRSFGASEKVGDEPVLTITGAMIEEYILEEGLDGYMGFEDTSLFEAFPDNSGGGTDGIFSGTIRTPIRNSRALMRIDVSELPLNLNIADVFLTLTVKKSGQTVDVIEYGLHRMTRDWGEGDVDGAENPSASGGGAGNTAEDGDATWNNAFHNQTAWTTPGGDFDPEPIALASAAGSGTQLEFSGEGLVQDVQSWIENPSQNFGWIIVSRIEGTSWRVKEFHSSEAAANRPRLTVMLAGATAPEDLDGDGMVNSVDIQLVINAVLGDTQGNIDPDVNGDGQVNSVDIQLVILAVLGL